jgi:hypothetical protein
MSEQARTPATTSASSVLSWCGANRHFVVAAVLLGATAAGWSVAVRVLKIATRKSAVVWAKGVEVDGTFRMTTLPDRMGPYELVTADGEVYHDQGKPVIDGKPDGVPEMPKDVMELLKIGTSTDESNLAERKSNWLSVRIYRDSRLPKQHPLRYWRLEVYYYTGGVDLVPHVPEICAVAGGATHLRTEELGISVPGSAGAWGAGAIAFRRALFERTNRKGQAARFVQYYTFSLNGKPESRREMVRLRLTNPFVRHAYFAKIQFSPVPVYVLPRPEEADAGAAEFVRSFLPHVLASLPTAADIEALDAGTGG